MNTPLQAPAAPNAWSCSPRDRQRLLLHSARSTLVASALLSTSITSPNILGKPCWSAQSQCAPMGARMGTVLGKGQFWWGARKVASHVPVAPRGLRVSFPVSADHPPPVLIAQMQCLHQIYFCKKLFWKLLELLPAAGAFLPPGQLCKTPKEQRLNPARVDQLYHLPWIAYSTDLKN